MHARKPILQALCLPWLVTAAEAPTFALDERVAKFDGAKVEHLIVEDRNVATAPFYENSKAFVHASNLFYKRQEQCACAPDQICSAGVCVDPTIEVTTTVILTTASSSLFTTTVIGTFSTVVTTTHEIISLFSMTAPTAYETRTSTTTVLDSSAANTVTAAAAAAKRSAAFHAPVVAVDARGPIERRATVTVTITVTSFVSVVQESTITVSTSLTQTSLIHTTTTRSTTTTSAETTVTSLVVETVRLAIINGSPGPESPSRGEGEMNSGRIAATAVGGVLTLAAIMGTIWILRKRRRYQRNKANDLETQQRQQMAEVAPLAGYTSEMRGQAHEEGDEPPPPYRP